MTTTVLLADGDTVVQESLKALLEREGFDVVGQVSNGEEAVRLAGDLHPDVAVLGFAMPLLNGLDAARHIHQVAPATRTLLLTIYTGDRYVLEALQAGIRGYVVKSQARADLVRAIREVASGRVYLSPVITESVVHAYLARSGVPADPLTPREREVLQLVAEGKTTKEIAQLLGVSVKTAEAHRTRLMAKLDVHNAAGLVRYAIRRGLVQP